LYSPSFDSPFLAFLIEGFPKKENRMKGGECKKILSLAGQDYRLQTNSLLAFGNWGVFVCLVKISREI
jgi:hypothetical protein